MHWRSRKVPARTTAACKPSTHCHHLPAIFVIFIWGNVFQYDCLTLWITCGSIVKLCAGWGLALLSLSTVTRRCNVSKVEGTLYNLYPPPLESTKNASLHNDAQQMCHYWKYKCFPTCSYCTTTCSQQYRYMVRTLWTSVPWVSLCTFWWPLTVYSLICCLSHNVVQQ